MQKKITAAERAQRKQQRRTQRRSYRPVAGVVTAAGVATAAGAAVGAGLQEQLDALSDRLSRLQEAAALVDIYGDLEETDSALAELPADLEAVRTRGYVFSNFLERKTQVLTDQWAEKRQQVLDAIDRRSAELARDVDEAERALQAAYTGGQAQVSRAENAIQQLESKVSAAQDAIEQMFDTLDENVTQVIQQIEAIEWTLDQAGEASFDFYEGEDFVAACQAQLVEMGQEGPKGILHLTDERLIFEQKEEVATKKFLFITTEKELVQKPIFEALVGHVDELKAGQEGLLGRKEMLQVLFAPEAPLTEVTLRLRGADNDQWVQLIGRVQSGQIEHERIQAGEDQAAAEELTVTVEEIPTKCPNCGAGFTQPIVRGMREITCEYCGTIARL
jgi:predicted  nucleic acid-binding Zn-ribbon protein